MPDFRFAVRQLLKNPGFTAVAVLTLALGIGAAAAVSAVVHGVLLQPLPLPSPQQLLVLQDGHAAKSVAGASFSPARFGDLRAQASSFQTLAAYYRDELNLVHGDQPQRISTLYTAGPLLETLGLAPLLGRGFTAEEMRDEIPVALLSYSLWQKTFGAPPEIIGQSINLGRKLHVVVGVLPPEARFPAAADCWIPLPLGRSMFAQDRWSRFLGAVGRLRPESTSASAAAQLSAISARLASAHAETDDGWVAAPVPLHEYLSGHARQTLGFISGAALLLLLLAGLNLSALLFARAQARGGEHALRSALGASWQKLLRPVLSEIILLTLAGGILGLLLARFLSAWLARGYASLLPPGGLPQPSLGQFLFALGALLLSALLAGCLPAWFATRANPAAALAGSLSRSTRGPRFLRLGHALVSAQFAGALVLLAAAGLLIRTIHRLESLPAGFNPSGLLTARLALPWERYGESAAFYSALLDQAAALPGVQNAAAINFLPFQSGSSPLPFQILGTPPDPARQAQFRCVSADYFQALGIPFLGGRDFGPSDHAEAPRRVIVNEAFARRFFPGIDPVGQRLDLDGQPQEIIGVTGSVLHDGLASAPSPEIFHHHLQKPWPQMTIALRAHGDPATLAPALQRIVSQFDSSQALFDVRTMQARVENSLAGRRGRSTLLASFAGAALLIALVGLAGSAAQALQRRTREMGIRLALGAAPSSLRALILIHGLKLAAIGLIIGLPLALAAGRLLRSQLHQIHPADPLTLAAVSLLLLLTALFACWLPSRRAARVDPIIALRAE